MLVKLSLAWLLQAATLLLIDAENYGSKSETPILKMLLEKMNKLEAENKMQQMEIERLKSQIPTGREGLDFLLKNKYMTRMRRDGENAVAFYGKMLTQHTDLSTNPVLKFNNVITNIGNAYSTNNGLFIAPVPGIYVFSTTVMTENQNDGHVGIFVNDKIIANIKLYGSVHTSDTMSQTAIYALRHHDAVSVRHYEGATVLHFEYTSFSAFLLQEDFGQLPGSTVIG